MTFKHRDCGGPVLANLARQLKLVSPGLAVTLDGIRPGVLEIQEINSGFCGYICLKCEHEIQEDEFENLLSYCFSCGHDRPVSEIVVTDVVPLVCKDCLKVLTGESEAETETMKRVQKLINIPDKFKQEILLEVMKKPVKLTN